MRKNIIVVAAWLSVIAMLWLFFLDLAPLDIKNLVIFVLVLIGSVMASAVDDKPRSYRPQPPTHLPGKAEKN